MSRFSRRLLIGLSLLVQWMGFSGNPYAADSQSNVLFIVDASGSMKKKVDGQQRIDVARKAFIETILSMPKSAHLGLMIYGARRAKDCTDIELVSPIGADDNSALVMAMTGLKAKGETPIA